MAFGNPVLDRELIENLRSSRAFIIQTVFVAALSTVVAFSWPAGERMEFKEELSLRLYDIFAQSQLVLLAILAPILSAPAITSERERKTIDLLLTTPLSPWKIVFGKFLSAITFLMLVSVSTLPIVSVCFMLGAVGYREVLATYTILFAALCTCGGIGLMASAYMGRSRGALAASYTIILPMALATAAINPMRNIYAAVSLSIVAFTVVMTILFLVRSRLRKEFSPIEKSADEENPDEQVGLVLKRDKFPDCLLSPKGTGKPLADGVNPMYEKELRHELFGRGTLLVRLLMQVSLFAALPFFIAALWAESMWVYSYYTIAFIMLIGPSLASGAFTQERERNTLDLLLATNIGKDRVIFAKFFSGLRSLGVLSGFLVAFMALLWILGTQRAPWYHVTVGTLSTIAVTAALTVCVTMFFSLICRTTLRSMVLSYLTLSFFFILPMFLQIILTGINNVSPHSTHWLALTSPFLALASVEPLEGSAYYGIKSLGVLFPSGVGSAHLLAYLLIAGLASVALIYFIRKKFDYYC